MNITYLSRIFRGKFIAGLKQLLSQDKLQFHCSLHELHDPERFRRFLRQLYTDQWVVYAKPPFGGAEHVLHYLARYTYRCTQPTAGIARFPLVLEKLRAADSAYLMIRRSRDLWI